MPEQAPHSPELLNSRTAELAHPPVGRGPERNCRLCWSRASFERSLIAINDAVSDPRGASCSIASAGIPGRNATR